jgi:uncharacterized membrane protein
MFKFGKGLGYKLMVPKQRKIVKLCLVILAISMIVMAVSTVVQIINSGWETFKIINIFPFVGLATAMIAILAGDKEVDDK